MIADRIEAWWKRSTRWGVWLSVIGFVIVFAGAAMNSEFLFFGIFFGYVGAMILALTPIGFAVSAGLREPAILPDRMRNGGIIAGAFGIYVGVKALMAGPRVEKGLELGILILLTSAIAIAAAVRAPRATLWRPAPGVILGLLGVIVFSWFPKAFSGSNRRAYYHEMQVMANSIRDAESAVHADSGHYTANFDSLTDPTRYHYNAKAEITLTSGGGYRARTTSAMLPEYSCEAVPEAVTCTPFPDVEVGTLAVTWLFMTVIMGLVGLAVRARATRQES